ncbi:hypothetical protein HIM_05261 [Hirsutella minnesotensis 3608]|uniref:Uncharacterized protein n=1 Tax=Hirsutella minnesotensis 3608 TaxID=1043627 RepID=A0A0F7ZPE0_9HYPO|nr:hypothetical protein HIM_05261 [Hirsutella minnesotensis 3608]
MKSFTLVAALLSAGVLCQDPAAIDVPLLDISDEDMDASAEELAAMITIDYSKAYTKNSSTYWEDTCFAMWGQCPGGTGYSFGQQMVPFIHNKQYNPESRSHAPYPPPPEFYPTKRNNYIKPTVRFKQEVVRRVENKLEQGEVTLGRVSEKITIDSTTSGWSVGVSGSAGLWNPTGRNGGIQISASYSSYTTKGTTVSVSDSTSATCGVGKHCWSEFRTAYIILEGVCRTTPLITCGWTAAPCNKDPLTSWPNPCPQSMSWASKVCPKAEKLEPCSIVTPLLRDGRPHVIEVFRDRDLARTRRKPKTPKPDLQPLDEDKPAAVKPQPAVKPPKPIITKYTGGAFEFGSEDYFYDPDRPNGDHYFNLTKGYYKDEHYPDLSAEIAQFGYPLGQLTGRIDESIKACFLDTQEWIYPLLEPSERYWSGAKSGRYSKPVDEDELVLQCLSRLADAETSSAEDIPAKGESTEADASGSAVSDNEGDKSGEDQIKGEDNGKAQEGGAGEVA